MKSNFESRSYLLEINKSPNQSSKKQESINIKKIIENEKLILKQIKKEKIDNFNKTFIQKERFTDFDYIINRKQGLEKFLDPQEIEQAAKGLLDYIKEKRMLKEIKNNINQKKYLAHHQIECTDEQKFQFQNTQKKDINGHKGSTKIRLRSAYTQQQNYHEKYIKQTHFQKTFESPQYAGSKKVSRKSSTFAFNKFNFEDRKFKVQENRFSFDFSNQKKDRQSTSPTNTEAKTLNQKLQKNQKLKNEELKMFKNLDDNLHSNTIQQHNEFDSNYHRSSTAPFSSINYRKLKSRRTNLISKLDIENQESLNLNQNTIDISSQKIGISSENYQQLNQTRNPSISEHDKLQILDHHTRNQLNFTLINQKNDIKLEDYQSHKQGYQSQKNNDQVEEKMKWPSIKIKKKYLSRQKIGTTNYSKAARESLVANIKKQNIRKVDYLYESRKLESVLNSTYGLGVTKISIPQRIRHMDNQVAIQAAYQAGIKAYQSQFSNSLQTQNKLQISKRSSIKSTAYTDTSKILQNSKSIFDNQKRNSLRNEVNQSFDKSILKDTFEKDSNANSFNIQLMNEAKSRLFRDKESGKIEDQDAGEDFLIHEQQNLAQSILTALNQANQIFKSNRNGQKIYEIKENVHVQIKLERLSVRDQVSKQYKDFKQEEFWIQKSFAKMKNSEDWETAINFISSGLIEIPLKFKLLYNYACLSEKLGRFEEAIKFFEFSMEIKPRYTDSLFALAVIYFKLGEYKECQKKIRVAIQNYKEDSKYRLEVMLYIQAMCFRCQQELRKSRRDYGALFAVFKQDEGLLLLEHYMGLMLLPLYENRVIQHIFLENSFKYINFFEFCHPLEKKMRLDQYANPKTKYLDFQKNKLNLVFAIENIPFFNRFDREILKEIIPFCKVEYFKREEIIFLLGRVGVVSHGSLRVMNHDQDIMQPQTIGRYKAGRIIGHGDTDNKITTHSQTWILSFDEMTEIVFMAKEVFDQLWIKLKNIYPQLYIVSSFLASNQIWKCLSDQTKIHLIFENVIIRKFRPGQLIIRANKRSILNQLSFGDFYKKLRSKVNDEVEKQILEKEKKKKQEYLNQEEDIQNLPPKDKVKSQIFQNYAQNTEQGAQESALSEQINSQMQSSVEHILEMFKETEYLETDGLYFVYHGNVDLLNPFTGELLHSFGPNEFFGESKIINQVTKEDLGDMYACLYPQKQLSFILKNDEKEMNFNLIKDKMKLSDLYRNGQSQQRCLDQIIQEDPDCVICFYISYKSIYDIVPQNELRMIKEELINDLQRKIYLNLIAGHYGLQASDFIQ